MTPRNGASETVLPRSSVAVSPASSQRKPSPFANVIPASRYASVPRNSFIDDLVAKKLQMLHIWPSEAASDSEWRSLGRW